MAGPLKTLLGALQASTFLAGVTVVYGEENVFAETIAPPRVVVVPTGGQIDNNPGYIANLDPGVELAWGIHENVDLYCFGFDIDPNAQPIDHADATEALRQQVLSALRDQQAQYTDVVNVAYGLSWRPVSERWEMVKTALVRYGRALVITVAIEISVPMSQPQEATIEGFQLSTTFTQGPS